MVSRYLCKQSMLHYSVVRVSWGLQQYHFLMCPAISYISLLLSASTISPNQQEFVQLLAPLCFECGESSCFHGAGVYQRGFIVFHRSMSRHGVFGRRIVQFVLVSQASCG